MLAYCHPGTVRHEFMESVIQLIQYPASKRPYLLSIAYVHSGPLISKSRNIISEIFLQNNQNFTHLLMCDTDIVFNPNHVQLLLDADKPIIGALYFGVDAGDFSTYTTVLRRKFQDQERHAENPLVPIPGAEVEGVMMADAIGMGLTLIKREVLETLGADHIKLWPFAEALLGDRATGEDVTFCLRAKEKGFDTWVHGDARVGHAKTFVING